MIKTVKIEKKLNLHELIEYISVSGIKDANFVSNYDNMVRVDHSGQITTAGKFYNDIFIDEMEEDITKDTELVGFQEVFLDKELRELKVEIHAPLKKKSINDVLEEHDEETECLQIYAKVNGKLQLIWEAE